RDLLVGRVEPQREIGRQHRRNVLLRLVEGVRNGGFRVLGPPLFRTGGALRRLPLVLEQVLEEEVAPLCWRLRRGDLRTARNGVATEAAAVLAFPAEALLLKRSGLGRRTDQRRIASAVRLAETVAAGDQSNGLLVIHRHAEKCFADIPGGRE